MKTKSYLTKELVTKANSYSFFRYIGMLPNPDKVLRRTGKSFEAFRDLKNDPHVWSCIQSRKSGLLSLEWALLPDGASDSLVRELESIFSGLDISKIQRDVLEAPLFGYQPMEIIWKAGAGDKIYLVPEKILPKPQEWFFFDPGGSLRYRTKDNNKGEPVPPMKVICVQYEADYMNPYGHSLLSKCYWPVTFKNGGLRFWVNFMEKYGMPMLLGQYTRGASFDEAQKLADELAGMTEDTVIVAPSDIKIELKEAVRSSSVSLYRDLIKHCNAEISKAILSQTLTTELDMGSYAASMTHYRIRREVIQSDIRLVEHFFNTLIRYIVELNFGSAECPRFKVLIDEGENMQKIDRDIKLAQSGALALTKEYWMKTYGFREEEVG